MFKFTGIYLRKMYPGDCISRVSNVMSNWLGLPYPPGRHYLRCDPYRESLGSLRAYYCNPHIITTSQSYCSFSFFFFFHLTYSRWTSSLPSSLWSQRIFPSLPGSRLIIFLSRCKFSTLTTRQPMVKFYLLTFPRFPLRKKEHKSYLGKNRTHDLPY